MSNEQFRDIVFAVSQSLRSEESHDIAYLHELPERFFHSRPIEVLMQLEIQQIIYKENPETLAKVMDRVKRADLASKVRKWTKKKNKNKQTSKSTGGSCDRDPSHLLHFELALAKMHIEHAAHRMNVLQEHIQQWTLLNVNFTMAIDSCRHTTHCLSTIEKRVRESPTLNSCSSSEEDIATSLSSSSSSFQERDHHRTDRRDELSSKRIRAGSIPLVGLTKESLLQIDTDEKRLSNFSNATGDDSGFADVRLFLRSPLNSFQADDSADNDEGIYAELMLAVPTGKVKELPEGSEIGYTKINYRDVIFNEYSTTRCVVNQAAATDCLKLDKGHSSPELYKLSLHDTST